MKITPELVAKLIFATTQLRFFEKEYRLDPSIEMQDIVIRWQCKVDSLLKKTGTHDFMPYDDILKSINVNE